MAFIRGLIRSRCNHTHSPYAQTIPPSRRLVKWRFKKHRRRSNGIGRIGNDHIKSIFVLMNIRSMPPADPHACLGRTRCLNGRVILIIPEARLTICLISSALSICVFSPMGLNVQQSTPLWLVWRADPSYFGGRTPILSILGFRGTNIEPPAAHLVEKHISTAYPFKTSYPESK
jgi:hypothetical protein